MASLQAAQMEALNEGNLKRTGQEMKEWEHKVWLYREVPIRGLHEVRLTDPPHFPSHSSHVIEIADVFDDRI